jgi:predicted NBD/HSP70 family sugar kinase
MAVVAGYGSRTTNRERVLRTMLRDGALARVDLAQRTGLTTAAISNITRELIADDLLREVGTARNNRVGANAILLDLAADAPLIGVVHQGVSALRVGLCTLRGRLVGRRVVATPERYTPAWAVATIATVLDELRVSGGYEDAVFAGVGVGLVGLVDVARGLVRRAPSLGWTDVPIADMLARAIGRPISVENNVRAMALGEALLGAGRSWSDFAFVYVGTGIAAGLIIDERAYRGARGGAGEIGHITVAPDGEPCACGNRGCLETVAAEPALVRHARDRGVDPRALDAPVKDAVRALAALARSGDDAARDVIACAAEALGIALADLTDIFNPDRIVLHGAVTEAGEQFFAMVAGSLHRHAFLAAGESIQLIPPTFGEDAGLIGAAAVALDAQVFRAPRERFMRVERAG